jgi:hypothetical protein
MDYLAIYSLVSDYVLPVSILSFIVVLVVFMCECDNPSDPTVPIISAGIVTVILFVCFAWCIGYTAEHTYEYNAGYNYFPNNDTYNEIIEIHNQQDIGIFPKLDDRLCLYKLGWEAAKKENDKQMMENTETALKNQITNQTNNLVQKTYNES